jgi:predicted dehydrogenase
MNPNESDLFGFNRRDFLKSGSFATLMTMMGGVELLGRAEDALPDASTGVKVKVAVIGMGAWGREMVKTLGTVDQAELASICDTYAPILKRAAAGAPGAAPVADYQAILGNKDIKAVIVATPSHKHKDIVLAALKAGKHVYCEAPLAHTIEDAKAISLAAKAAPQGVIFQCGLQVRCDPQRRFLLPFIRSGALGKTIEARAQWHKKTSWRSASSNPEQEKALNWRLSRETSPGLIGEIGIHQVDQAGWFLNKHPVAVTGFNSLAFWNKDNRDAPDDRDVPDTVQAVFEYPGGVRLMYDATLANSFDAAYEIYYGSDAAVMLREAKAWMFKETDSPLLGWEVYAPKQEFYQATGIALIAGHSKSAAAATKKDAVPKEEPPYVQATLATALTTFLKNIQDVEVAMSNAEGLKDDPDALKGILGDAMARLRPAPGYLEGFQATALAIKANEAILAGKRIELQQDLFELS